MAEVIVVTSGKGGVGKTTTVANLGVGLSALNKKVVMIDTDIGLRNLDVALGHQDSIVYDLLDVIKGICTPAQAAIEDKRFDGLFLIPAAQTFDQNVVNAENMKELAERLKKEYDFILIDCPAGIDKGFKNAVAAADKAIVVTTPDLAAIRDADRVLGLLEGDEIDDCLLLINKIRPELIKNGHMMNVDDVLSILSTNLLGVIPDDPNILISASQNEPVVKNPKSLAGQAYQNIVKRLMGEDVPLIDFDGKSFLKKYKKLFRRM